MKIDVYSTMHNEELMLPYFLRHYEKVADRIFVWEDGSTDDTRKILEAHPKVIIMPIERTKIDDHYWVRHVWPRYKRISRGKADWVIVVDADEFVWYLSDLRGKLESMAAEKNGGQIVYTPGYMMMASEFPYTDGQIYDAVTTGIYDPLQSKRIIFSPDIYLRWKAGRHWVHKISPGVKTRVVRGLKLLHYKYLGDGYFMARCRRNMERMSETNIKHKWHYSNDLTLKKPHTLHWYREKIKSSYKVI